MEKTNFENLDPEVKFFETKKIGVRGMTCDKCVQTVEKALRKVNGVTDVHVDRAASMATVKFDTRKTDMPALHDTLLSHGYTPTPPSPS